MAGNYRYVFWDFDGTVMDTYPGVSESMRAALEAGGIHEDREEVLRSFIGPPLRDILRDVFGTDRELSEKIVDAYRCHYNAGAKYKGDMFPGVKEAAESFRKAGLGQYITSSKPTVYCEDIIDKKGWRNIFDGVFGATLDAKIDSKDEVINEAMRVLGITDKSCAVLIGDTKYDADGAAAVGIDCVGITYGFGSRQELSEHGAAAVFDSIGEAADFILRNAARTV